MQLGKTTAPTPVAKPEDIPMQACANGSAEPERSVSDDSLEPES